MADGAGRTDPIGAEDISRLLAEHHPLRLVVLNACDTGRGSATDAFSSTAAALIRREIPAVMAMRFAITDPAAIRFAQAFYEYVAKRRPVDDSVMRARRALRLGKKDSLEWGTPVLYLRASDGRIFDATIPPQPGPSRDPVPTPEMAAPPPTPAHQKVLDAPASLPAPRLPSSQHRADPAARPGDGPRGGFQCGWISAGGCQHRWFDVGLGCHHRAEIATGGTCALV